MGIYAVRTEDDISIFASACVSLWETCASGWYWKPRPLLWKVSSSSVAFTFTFVADARIGDMCCFNLEMVGVANRGRNLFSSEGIAWSVSNELENAWCWWLEEWLSAEWLLKRMDELGSWDCCVVFVVWRRDVCWWRLESNVALYPVIGCKSAA